MMDDKDVLGSLLGRCSVGPKHLEGPAPGDDALLLMTEAALRAPDHGQLVPFRFALIRDESARQRLADLYGQVALGAGMDTEAVALDRQRALEPPLLVAVIARIDESNPAVPAHEQWMAVGGAVANFLNAAHMLGFAGKMLSGAKARAYQVAAAFCAPGETLVGWMVLGTPRKRMSPKPGKPDAGEVLRPWTA